MIPIALTSKKLSFGGNQRFLAWKGNQFSMQRNNLRFFATAAPGSKVPPRKEQPVPTKTAPKKEVPKQEVQAKKEIPVAKKGDAASAVRREPPKKINQSPPKKLQPKVEEEEEEEEVEEEVEEETEEAAAKEEEVPVVKKSAKPKQKAVEQEEETQDEGKGPEGPVLLTDGVDLTRIRFGDVKKGSKGGNFQNIYYWNQGNPLRIQTPSLRLPFGVSKTFNEQGAPRLQLSFDSVMEENSNSKQLYDFIGIFEEVVVLHGQRESKKLFDKPIGGEVVKFNFKSALKKPTDYAPLMSLKLPESNGRSLVKVWSSQKEPLTLDAVKKNAKVTVIAEPSSVWVVNNNWGVTWKALQIRVDHEGEEDEEASGGGYSFLNGDQSEE